MLATPGKGLVMLAESEMEERIKIAMQRQYGNVMQAFTAYEAAWIGKSNAELSWANAQGRYQLGWLGRVAYIKE